MRDLKGPSRSSHIVKTLWKPLIYSIYCYLNCAFSNWGKFFITTCDKNSQPRLEYVHFLATDIFIDNLYMTLYNNLYTGHMPMCKARINTRSNMVIYFIIFYIKFYRCNFCKPLHCLSQTLPRSRKNCDCNKYALRPRIILPHSHTWWYTAVFGS